MRALCNYDRCCIFSLVFFYRHISFMFLSTERVKMKSVQILALSGEEPSKKYFHKGSSDDEVLSASVPLAEIPVIDLTLLSSQSSEQELQKLWLALRTWGCIQVINHGMTGSFLDTVREIGKEFFLLPAEEKLKYLREDASIEGYGNDTVLSENQRLDWTDRLVLTVSPEERKQLKFWPKHPEAFSETLQEYTMKSAKINEILLKAMSKSLSLEENCFLNQYGGGVVVARFNLYPSCPRPEKILGVKAHSDASTITVLLQDKEVEGLQIQKDNQWYRVPVIRDALFINVGDLVEIMSNGIFKSPVHRVLTNSERERSSLALFFLPAPEREIKPADELVSETTPKLYKSVKDYTNIYFQHVYREGKGAVKATQI